MIHEMDAHRMKSHGCREVASSLSMIIPFGLVHEAKHHENHEEIIRQRIIGCLVKLAIGAP
jgi:hypothetical protein